ncbi:hypothetical protein [Bacillus mycoides]|uniref:hypothetical protein n=1 Tax=Bacillus mycoides TaxID=1405 RepID=UPI0010BF5EC3|nr:hypothetical protein [Bacillus mycoides]TKI45566.1 hypothetical protein FC700_10480 [Bacillus mycoides]
MANQTVFFKFVRSKGNLYVYLAKGIRIDGKKKTITIYSFGKILEALEKLYSWRENFEEMFPEELIELGYYYDDLDEWILTLETGYSKRGRKLLIACM